MEKYIKIETQKGESKNVIEINNEAPLNEKTFKAVCLDSNNKSTSSVNFSLSELNHVSGSKEYLTIGDLTLVGREVELLREFLNQE